MVRLDNTKNTPQLGCPFSPFNTDFNMIGSVNWAQRVQKHSIMVMNISSMLATSKRTRTAAEPY
jgi:hypothetical protein